MEKINKIKDIFVKVGDRYKGNFSFSIDVSFNSCINEAKNILCQNYQNDIEAHAIFNSIVSYLSLDISQYASSRFEKTYLDRLVNKIEDDNRKNFDNQFLEYVKDKVWINPIERRLKELLEKDKKSE